MENLWNIVHGKIELCGETLALLLSPFLLSFSHKSVPHQLNMELCGDKLA